MNQFQSFHTSGYRGNQQGHDAYKRSDSNQPSSFGSSIGTQVTSQYRGQQKAFQPTGPVQSVYGQNQQNNFSSGQFQTNQLQNQFSSAQSSNQSPQSFHTASYKGNQPNHDAYKRSDSTRPSQSGFASFNTSNQFVNQSQFGGASQNQSPQSFHTASYQGNQPNHDAYLRSDSTQPSQQGFSSVAGLNPSSINPFTNIQAQSQAQAQSPQSFHTASYQGNQPNHDAYKRADSTSPSSQFGAFGSR